MKWIPVIFLLAVLLISWAFYYRLRKWTFWQKVTLFSGLIYFLTVVWLTFYPAGMTFFAGGYKPIKYFGNVAYNLVALRYFDGGFVENIIMTIPAGVYLSLAKPKLSKSKILLWSLVPGLVIESCQFFSDLTVNLQRVVDIDDLCANTLGMLIGYGIVFLLKQTDLNKVITKLTLTN